MYNPSALVSQHDEHKQHAALDGRHDEEITRRDVFDMVGEKGPPSR
jgi:hypothetical protein